MHPATASLATGGLLATTLRRIGAMPDGACSPLRASLLLVLLTWVPLVVLAALAGTLLGDAVEVPLLHDPAVHAKLLVALPLLLVAEQLVPARVRQMLQEVRERRLLDASARPELERAVQRLVAARDSRAAELAIVVVVVLILWLRHPAIAAQLADGTTWVGREGALSPAGWWYVTVCLFVTFLLGFRWAWWIVAWTRFLTGALRRHLVVLPGHPDGCAGLSFLTPLQGALAPVFAAMAVAVSGRLGDAILHEGMTMAHAAPVEVVVLAVAALVMFGPLLLFAPRIEAARRHALLGYDHLGQRVVGALDEYRARAADEDAPLPEDAAGTVVDFSLAYDEVKETLPVPLDLWRAIPPLLLVAAPFVPLLLAEMSIPDLVGRVLNLLL